MAPPFRVDTEIPVEFDEREDLQGHDQNSLEARDSCHAPAVELDECRTSRDETTLGRHAASLHKPPDSSQTRPTSPDVDHQSAPAQLPNCGVVNDHDHDDTDDPVLEINEDVFAADLSR